MIFSSVMGRLDRKNVEKSLGIMENHIRSMQEQLEYTLYNLDSSNITSLDTALTDISSEKGGMTISGESIALTGAGGERVVMGDQGGLFRLELAGRGGVPALWLDGSGNIVIGSRAEIHADCGRWD